MVLVLWIGLRVCLGRFSCSASSLRVCLSGGFCGFVWVFGISVWAGCWVYLVVVNFGCRFL